MLQKTKGATRNGHSRDTGNIGHTRHRTQQAKNKNKQTNNHTNKTHTHTTQKVKKMGNTDPPKMQR